MDLTKVVKDKVKNASIVFFDIDGTLTIPRFKYGGKYKVGVPEEVWYTRCMDSIKNPYDDCGVPSCMIDFMEYLTLRGVEIQCLTVETDSRAYFHKVDFVLKNYARFFTSFKNIDYVCSLDEKITFMKRYAKTHELSKSSIVLVDDNYDVAIKAQNEGFGAIIVSEFFDRR